MTIQKISPIKLQVSISNDDIESLHISRDSLTRNSPEAQNLISDIIAAAKTNCEFEPVGENIIVEATASEDDGIEFCLTVVDGKVNIKQEKQTEMTLLRVTSGKNLTATCLHLAEKYVGESYLFKYQGSYYIALRTKLLPRHACYDYGEIVDNSDNFFAYLKENGSVLVDGDLFDARISNKLIA